MSRAQDLPQHRPVTVEEFLAFAGWNVEPHHRRDAIATALAFYQRVIPRHELMRRVARPSPWSLPRNNVVKLSELMQAIDFTAPVEGRAAGIGQRFKCYRPRDERATRRPRGRWFTWMSSRQDQLALPGDQDRVRVYVVHTPVQFLRSTVSDAFTWIRASEEEIARETAADKYYRGGGTQCFIWNADAHLRLVG